MPKGSIGAFVAPVAMSSAMISPTPGPNWKPCAEKPKAWNAFSCVADCPDDRDVVRHAPLDAGPGAHDRGGCHDRKDGNGRLGRQAQLLETHFGNIVLRLGAPAPSASDDDRAVRHLLEGKGPARRADDGVAEARHAAGDDHHRSDRLHRGLLAELARDLTGPCAGAVENIAAGDDRAVPAGDRPVAAFAADQVGTDVLVKAHAERTRLALEGEGRPIGQRESVVQASEAADAVARDGRKMFARLRLSRTTSWSKPSERMRRPGPSTSPVPPRSPPP